MVFPHEVALKPFNKRLEWLLWEPPNIEIAAEVELQKRTDHIRKTSIPRYHKHGLDLLTQWALIHRQHMFRNEQLVLSPQQADHLLNRYNAPRIDGIIRDPDRLPIDVMIGGGIAIAAPTKEVCGLLTQLAHTAESFFPRDAINPQVNMDNIYHYLSYIQYVFALIHPFYEAVGRTSEDLLYTLWRRRPDLRNSIRFLSSTGLRDDVSVRDRMKIINRSLSDLNLEMGQNWGLSKSELQTSRDTDYLTADRVINKASLNNNSYFTGDSDYENFYVEAITTHVQDMLSTPQRALEKPPIQELAQNLANSSKNYILKTGDVLELKF